MHHDLFRSFFTGKCVCFLFCINLAFVTVVLYGVSELRVNEMGRKVIHNHWIIIENENKKL